MPVREAMGAVKNFSWVYRGTVGQSALWECYTEARADSCIFLQPTSVVSMMYIYIRADEHILHALVDPGACVEAYFTFP
jgi:hypothetical protein